MRRVLILCAFLMLVAGLVAAQVPAEPETPPAPAQPAGEPQVLPAEPEQAPAAEAEQPEEVKPEEAESEPPVSEAAVAAAAVASSSPSSSQAQPPADEAAPAEAPAAAGQEADENDITNGEFALLLLQALATHPKPEMPLDEALVEVQDLDLMDGDLQWEDPMIHLTLAKVLGQMGVLYQPAEGGAFVSHAFAEAMLRRHLLSIRQFRGWLVRHGVTDDNFMDEGGDRRVSPFEYE